MKRKIKREKKLRRFRAFVSSSAMHSRKSLNSRIQVFGVFVLFFKSFFSAVCAKNEANMQRTEKELAMLRDRLKGKEQKKKEFVFFFVFCFFFFFFFFFFFCFFFFFFFFVILFYRCRESSTRVSREINVRKCVARKVFGSCCCPKKNNSSWWCE